MAGLGAKGRLYITVLECKELANKELLGKMDPYVTLDITGSKEKHKTKTISGGHTTPKFNQSFIFNLEGKEDLFHANVYDHETLGSDDHVGRCDISLDKLDITDKPNWYDLRDKNNFTKIAGYICLTCKFDGTGWPNQTTVAPTPAPAPAPAPAAAPAPAPAPIQQQQPIMYQAQPQFAPVYAPHPHGGSVIYAQAPPGQPIMYAAQPQQQPLVYAQQQPVVYAQQPQPGLVYAQPGQPLIYAQQPPQYR